MVYHWRKKGGAEVDLVLAMNNKLYPIEFKLGTTLNKHDTRGIMAFRDEYGDTVQQGLLIYPGKICYQLSEFVTALPFDALMKSRAISLDPIIEQRKKELETQYSRL